MSGLFEIIHFLKEMITSGFIFRPFEVLGSAFPWLNPHNGLVKSVFDPETDIPDLSGRTILVTGGTAGLGQETVLQLSKHGAQVILAARDPKKAKQTVAKIQGQFDATDVQYVHLDLGSLASVKQAAEHVKSRFSKLDVLINNAGSAAVRDEKTSDGIELSMGVNYVGHFYLTALLLPLLNKAASFPGSDVRVINLSSLSHNTLPPGGFLFSDEALSKHSPYFRYSQAKCANVLFTRELARRHTNIQSTVLHPGVIRTELLSSVGDTAPFFRMIYTIMEKLMVLSVADGAKTQLMLSVSKEVKSGSYYVPFGIECSGSPISRDAALAEKLWNWTEQLLESKGFGVKA